MKTPKQTQAPAVMDDVLRRMLVTPPDPHKSKPEKAKPKAIRKPKAPKKRPA